MILKNKEIEIPAENPFENDQLNRKDSVVALTNLIGTIHDPMVLCINAPWGQGKTTFLRLLRQHLINEGFSTLHFNAWENDFSDDALVSLIGEIETGIQEIISKDTESAAQKIFEESKKYGAVLAKKGLPILIKALTSGMVDIGGVGDDIASLAQTTMEEKIRQYDQSKKTVNGFRDTLAKFVAQICREESGRKQLIFIIDELDRCRPPYAIEILEKAKHLFSVKNIIFVLGLDKRQLGHSIRSVYGSGMDVDGYLRRFIDLEYSLEIGQKSDFLNYLLDSFQIEKQILSKTWGSEDEIELLNAFMNKSIEAFELTLREQEQFFSIMSVVFRFSSESELLFPAFLSLLTALKVKMPDLFKKFFNPNFVSENFRSDVRQSQWYHVLFGSNISFPLEVYFAYCNGNMALTQLSGSGFTSFS